MGVTMSEIAAWVTHGFRKRGIELHPRLVWVILALLVLIGLLGTVRLVMVSYVVAAARDLQDARAELSELQQDNADIEAEIARLQSVDVMLARMEEMNLHPAEQVEFLDH
jgi:cell division protein FtsB